MMQQRRKGITISPHSSVRLGASRTTTSCTRNNPHRNLCLDSNQPVQFVLILRRPPCRSSVSRLLASPRRSTSVLSAFARFRGRMGSHCTCALTMDSLSSRGREPSLECNSHFQRSTSPFNKGVAFEPTQHINCSFIVSSLLSLLLLLVHSKSLRQTMRIVPMENKQKEIATMKRGQAERASTDERTREERETGWWARTRKCDCAIALREAQTPLHGHEATQRPKQAPESHLIDALLDEVRAAWLWVCSIPSVVRRSRAEESKRRQDEWIKQKSQRPIGSRNSTAASSSFL